MNWSLSWHGLRTVAGLELRQRVRSRGWVIALVCWFVVIGAVTSLIIAFTHQVYDLGEASGDQAAYSSGGPLAFGIITLFVLAMGLVIAPAFTATSINGDRQAGTLATLQATSLSALEIAAGKLAAAWLTAAVFLVVALPFIVWSVVLGGIGAAQVIVCFAVVLAEVLIVCAIGLGWSAVITRTVGSTIMTYLCVLTLSVLSLFVMLLLMPLVTDDHATVRSWSQPDVETSSDPEHIAAGCRWVTLDDASITHTERIWWLSAANPFVIVADAAPLPDAARDDVGQYASEASDPLALIRVAMLQARRGTPAETDDCVWAFSGISMYRIVTDDDGDVRVYRSGQVIYTSPVKDPPLTAGTPIWPWGLGVHLVFGAAGFVAAVRRLSVPYGKLPKGTRIA